MNRSSSIPTSVSSLALALLLAVAPAGIAANQREAAPAESPAETATSQAARKLAEAHEALRAAGLDDEAATIEKVINEAFPNKDDHRGRGWRWSRGSDRDGDKISSEISGLFRAMFEIIRGVEEHEASLNALRQRERLAESTGPDPAARRDIARLRTQILAERAEAITRLRERAPEMRKVIDRALKNLENTRPDSPHGPRMQLTRERLTELRQAMEKSTQSDDQFYAALRAFAEGSPMRRGNPDRHAEPPDERIQRVQREINILQDRLRELEGEMRRLRQSSSARPHDPPPPLREHAPPPRVPPPDQRPGPRS